MTTTIEQPTTCELPLDAIKFRKDLYPRIHTSAETVQKYAEDLSVLPPIEVNQHGELIDGWHRWTAHKSAGAATIFVVTTETASDADLLALAIERNAKHGLQLSREDKQEMARSIFRATPERERGKAKQRIAAILSVSERTVRGWVSRIDQDSRDARDKRIFDLWLACHTQEEIADRLDCDRYDVDNFLRKSADLPEYAKPAANHQIDFEPPLYNVWQPNERTDPVHFGDSDPRWIDNLLYLYTQPFDIVVDPFAGRGSTIDVCRKRFRRYFVCDPSPVVERADEIRQHDVTQSMPPLARWSDVRLVYVAPPLLPSFSSTVAGVVNGIARKLKPGAFIALLLDQPSRTEYTDHFGDMVCAIKLPIHRRMLCPRGTESFTPEMVEWAKKNRKVLVTTRDIVIWRVQ